MHRTHSLLLVAIVTVLVSFQGAGQEPADDFLRSFLPGREYYFLRSGNAKLILQADKHGMAPAFTYMLFDANKPCQTLRKDRAFNFSKVEACSGSALEVVLGGVPFTALGQTTDVRWVYRNGIPEVEALWWAGGVRVKESFVALEGANGFLRKIVLNGKDLAGPDSVRLRLHLPTGRYSRQGGALAGVTQTIALAIGFDEKYAGPVNEVDGTVESSPIALAPGKEVTVTSFLLSRIPAQGHVYEPRCGFDEEIEAEYLWTERDANGVKGLRGEYYNSPDPHPDTLGTPIVVRIDTSVTPYWDTGSPAEGVRADSFSVRWSGFIRAPRTGLFTFSLVADDRARLFVNDSLLIDCWENAWNVTKTGDVYFEKEKMYPLRIEYADLSAWAGMRLKWSLPSVPPDEKEVEAGLQEIFAGMNVMQKSLATQGLSRTRQQWALASMIEAGDSLVQRLFDRSKFALPGMVGTDGLMDAGVFEYGLQWVRDGSNVALGLIHAGHFESARGLLNHIVTNLVSAEGTTMIAGGFDQPDREQFDQMGELMHALKSYRDWTGDSSLVVDNRAKLLAMIERPLDGRFRDSTGMVHNRREYWERTFEDAYELAYQTFMVRGLRDAADLAGFLGVPEKAPYWRREADRFLKAMLQHPSRSLVHEGALIKRRNVDGTIADFIPGPDPKFLKDDPYSTEAAHRLNPDASYAMTISLRVVDPRSDLARKTLDKLEAIWNARWTFGGYERYHSSSQIDQPGPWTFATASIARAQHDAGMLERSRRSLEWLLNVQGGNAGAWFEEIPLLRSQMPVSGIVPWASAEVTLFTVRHWLGISFEGENMVIRPNLFRENRACKADLRFRSSRIRLEVDRAGEVSDAVINGKKVSPRKDGSILVPPATLSRGVEIKVFSRAEPKLVQE